MASPVARQECDLTALEHSADISVRRRSKRRLHPHFLYFRQPRHFVEAAAADYSDFRLSQSSSRNGARTQVKPVIIQDAKHAPLARSADLRALQFEL